MIRTRLRHLLIPVITLALLTPTPGAQAGWVLSEQKITEAIAGFGGAIDPADHFGLSVASLGDLDGDGVLDLAVGADGDDDGGGNRGAVWILFLDRDGTVKSEQKISSTSGGFGGSLGNLDMFGVSIDSLGDLDGDGVTDLAVGAWFDDDGGLNRGSVWILFLNSDGTVKSEQKISQTIGGFGGTLSNQDGFGYSVDGLEDLDGDGVDDLAVGAMYDDDGGTNRGAVWILMLNSDGTVKSEQKISQTAGGFGGTLTDTDTLGVCVASLGDLDGDGVCDLAAGADHDDDGGYERGAIWILFLNSDGTVKSEQKLSSTSGGLGDLEDEVYLGLSASSVGDLDGDGRDELVVSAIGDDDGGSGHGALWVLFLNADGTVRARHKISDTAGGFEGTLGTNHFFGYSVDQLGDLDGDGFCDLAVGAIGDTDAGGIDAGAVWVLTLQGCPTGGATFRNPDLGGQTNPPAYSVISPPLLGGTFTASIAGPSAVGSFLVGYAQPTTLASVWGNILADHLHPQGELLGWPFAAGDPAIIDIAIPDDPWLCGIELVTQGVRFGGGTFELTNAQDLVVGR
jgi:hypothetical protein